MQTNLLGRTARGQSYVPNPKNTGWMIKDVEGRVAAVTASSSGESLYVWLESDGRLFRCGATSLQLIPAELATPLR